MVFITQGSIESISSWTPALKSSLAGTLTGYGISLCRSIAKKNGTTEEDFLSAIGGGVSAGAISGAAAGNDAASAFVGALTGMSSSALMTFTPLALSIPIGCLIIGADAQGKGSQDKGAQKFTSASISWDCWKAILREPSTGLSSGKLLKDIVGDCRVKCVYTSGNVDSNGLPKLVIENIWGERFDLAYVKLPSNHLATHAVKQTNC